MEEMKALVLAFPDHLEAALKSGMASGYRPSGRKFENIVITGLGGSGIGGRIVSQLVAPTSATPVVCANDYKLPGFVGKHSLVVISSYSGDTEETVSAMKLAHQSGAEIACITSGGKVLEFAHEHRLNCMQLPSGNPPRAMLGFSLVMLHFILWKEGCIDDRFILDFQQAARWIRNEGGDIEQTASKIADGLGDRIPVLYAGSDYEGLLIRWRQQLNENSKLLCWHHVFPEMNHNELVGWTGGDERFAVVMIHNEDDHPRVKLRMKICRELIEERSRHITEVWGKGENAIARLVYLVHLGDLLSVVLAERRGVNPVEIPAIQFLKNELSRWP